MRYQLNKTKMEKDEAEKEHREYRTKTKRDLEIKDQVRFDTSVTAAIKDITNVFFLNGYGFIPKSFISIILFLTNGMIQFILLKEFHLQLPKIITFHMKLCEYNCMHMKLQSDRS